jgi:hypothetical protein
MGCSLALAGRGFSENEVEGLAAALGAERWLNERGDFVDIPHFEVEGVILSICGLVVWKFVGAGASVLG